MTPERQTDAAFGVGLVVGLLFLVAVDAFRVTAEVVSISDFSGMWMGAHAVADGLDPYDATTWRAVAAGLGGQQPDTPVFGYPPWVAFALVPFGLLPLSLAAALWIWTSVAAAVIAMRALLRAFLPGYPLGHSLLGVCLLASQPGYQSLFNHQWTYLLVAATATCLVALRARRDLAAATIALLWLAKPQLFVFTAAGWGWAHRRFATMAAFGGGVIVVASWLAVPHWWAAWSTFVAPVRLVQPATLPALLADIVGPPGRIAGYGLILAGAAVASRFRSGGDGWVATWSALSIAGAVYAWSYDQLLLLVPLTVAVGVLGRIDPVAGRRLLLAGFGLLMAGAPLLYGLAFLRGRETASAILPAVIFVLIAWRLWPVRFVS